MIVGGDAPTVLRAECNANWRNTNCSSVCLHGNLNTHLFNLLGLLLEISLYVQILSSFVPNYRATIIASILS